MSVLNFILTTIFSFYMIYKAIINLDKIYNVKKNGIRKQAKVIKIREEISHQMDEDDVSSSTYYYTVNFKDKNGREIEKEIEFDITKKPKSNPPFSIDIIYRVDENKKIDIILENSKKTIFDGYFLLSVGLAFLGFIIYNYDNQINIIIEFLNNLFK
ncbi:hypothetical protein [uncultured Polaribacter sp.]|uniref:hypothetical protein n=1 Tax=uncultured Polaribacter sp. TaxID=174711 RepID=UPI00260CCC16|nr:hypothetical protein [uncultured Polaribacter sp.]